MGRVDSVRALNAHGTNVRRSLMGRLAYLLC